MKNLILDCITDWHWWADGLSFILFMAVVFAYFIIFAA